jgi:hypothetical protein
MSFVEAIAQTLTEVAKDDLVAGKKYLMVDEEHAIVVECGMDLEYNKLLAVAHSYLIGFTFARTDRFKTCYLSDEHVKFFQLPG